MHNMKVRPSGNVEAFYKYTSLHLAGNKLVLANNECFGEVSLPLWFNNSQRCGIGEVLQNSKYIVHLKHL